MTTPSMFSTRRRARTAGAVAALALLAGACDQVDQAVDAGREAVESATDAVAETSGLVQFCTSAARVAQAVEDEDVDAAVQHGESMVQHAPDPIASDAQFVLDEAKRAQGGDFSGLQTEEFKNAAAAVASYAKEHCDPR